MNVGRLAARVGPSLRAARVGPSVRGATTDAVPRAATANTAPRAASAGNGEHNELARVEKRVNEVAAVVRSNATWNIVLGVTYVIAFVTLSGVINAQAWDIKTQLKAEIRQDLLDSEMRIKDEIRSLRQR